MSLSLICMILMAIDSFIKLKNNIYSLRELNSV